MRKRPQRIEFGGRQYAPRWQVVVVRPSFAHENEVAVNEEGEKVEGRRIEKSFSSSVLKALVGVKIMTCLNARQLGLIKDVDTLLASVGDLMEALINAGKVKAAQELFAECNNEAGMMIRFPPGTYAKI